MSKNRSQPNLEVNNINNYHLFLEFLFLDKQPGVSFLVLLPLPGLREIRLSHGGGLVVDNMLPRLSFNHHIQVFPDESIRRNIAGLFATEARCQSWRLLKQMMMGMASISLLKTLVSEILIHHEGLQADSEQRSGYDPSITSVELMELHSTRNLLAALIGILWSM